MVTKKLLLAIATTAITVSNAFSTIYRVDNNAANNPDFTSLQAAHDGLAHGDTLYVSGSVSSYYSLELTKTLYIFGPGYFLSENPETIAKFLTAKLGTILFRPGSEGSLLTGFEIKDGPEILLTASNITLKRNRITNWQGIKVHSSNLIISQNYIQCPIWVYSSASNVIIRNNFIAGPIRPGSGNPPIPLDIRNNVFLGDITINSSVFYNNILRGGNFSAIDCDVRNNIGNSTQFGSSDGNQENVDMNTVFIGTGSTDGRWQLAPGSPAIGAGVFGEDCGMFGGHDPYVLSGLPAIPAIYLFIAPVSASGLHGLPVQVKIKSHN